MDFTAIATSISGLATSCVSTIGPAVVAVTLAIVGVGVALKLMKKA